MTDDIELDEQRLDELDELEAEAERCEAESGDKKQKPSKEDLCKSLDYLAQNPVLADAMRHIGRRPNTVFLWIKASREGDPKFRVRWPSKDGGECMYHEAILTARSMQLAAFEGLLRRDVSVGTPRVLRQQSGEPVWEIDSLAIAQYKDAATAEAAGLSDWPFAHTQDGARIAVVVFELAPAALRQHAARSLLAGYNPSDRKEIDNRLSGGVMIVRATAQGDDAAKIAPPYSREAMATPAKPMTDLQRDLLTRLEDLRQKGPDRATARPSLPVDLGAGSSSGGNDPPERRAGDGKAA